MMNDINKKMMIDEIERAITDLDNSWVKSIKNDINRLMYLLENNPKQRISTLNQHKPLTLEQASRIPGISVNDLMIIKYYIETNK